MLRTSRFWRRIRYSNRSSGPSNASRNTCNACGGMYRSFGGSVSASPSTIANGISSWRGGGTGSGTAAGVVSTSLRSGFTMAGSAVLQTHRGAHLLHRGPGALPGLLAARGNDAPNHVAIVLVFPGTCPDSLDLGEHRLDQRLLAVEAADARRPAAGGRPGPGL